MFKSVKNKLYKGERQSLAALIFGLFATLFCGGNQLYAQNQLQDHQQLYQLASDFIEHTTGQQASIKPLNANNRIPACLTTITTDFPFNNRKTVRLQCDKTTSQKKPNWRLHLQVNLTANLEAWQAMSDIKAGQLISASDFQLATYNGHDFGQFVNADQSPIGRYSKHHLKSGHWLKKEDLSESIQIWQSTRLIPAETVITQSMLTNKRVNRRQTSANAMTNLNNIIGKVSKRNLAAGHTITSNDITGRTQVLVATKNLPPNRSIVASDLDLKWHLDSKLRQPGFTDKHLIIGKIPRSYIASGRVITENLLRTPYTVAKGNVIQLVYKTANLSISSDAKALANGNLGDIIKVEVLGSSKVKQGKVVAKGVVELVE